jgi:hypothetical protein
MPGFRDCPLTWLFIAATICVDLVMVLPMMLPSRPFGIGVSGWIVRMGVPAQLSLMAIWAATSPTIRLARGALLTASVYLALLPAMLIGFPWQELAPYYFVFTLVIWGSVLALGMVGLLPGWIPDSSADSMAETRISALETDRWEEGDRSRKARSWQFSLVELFGWTCVVALWAFAAHHAYWNRFSWHLLIGVVVPLLMVFLLGGPGSWRLRIGCLGIVISFMLMIAPRGFGIFLIITGQIPALYLAFWYVVRRLDGALGESHGEARNPQHALFPTDTGLNKFE